jgi:hypothetical protein
MQAALVEGLAVQGGADLARGALEQPHAQPRLQLLHGLGGGRARQVQIGAAWVKLRRSTIRTNRRIASNRSTRGVSIIR